MARSFYARKKKNVCIYEAAQKQVGRQGKRIQEVLRVRSVVIYLMPVTAVKLRIN